MRYFGMLRVRPLEVGRWGYHSFEPAGVKVVGGRLSLHGFCMDIGFGRQFVAFVSGARGRMPY